MERQYELILNLSNGAISNDLETQNNQGHAITRRWISQKLYEIDIVMKWNTNSNLHMAYSSV